MKRFVLVGLLAVLALGLSACACSFQMVTLDRLEASVKRQHGLYLTYVKNDPKLSKEQKEIEEDNTKSQLDLIGSIRRAHE